MIRDDIKAAQVTAMKAGDKEARAAIGLIQAAIKNRDIELRTGTAPTDDDAVVVEVLQKMVKQRRESIQMYESGGRQELADAEKAEVAVIERFLPAQMSDAEIGAAIEAIKAQGWGILLYLRQEGRGIGLVNKLRAYALQDQGFDTVDANTRLGFAIDARDFGVAARMLSLLGQRTVRLLTNNPAKVAGLEAAGVTVIERVAHALPPNPHNARYLATKRDRTGHQL